MTLDAPFLMRFFDTVLVTAAASWTAILLFFSFAIVPIVFRDLDADLAARFVRSIFPRYYAWLTTLATIALPAAICGPLAYPEYRSGWVSIKALMIIVAILISIYSSESLVPAINAARDGGAALKVRFDRLHRLSMRLNFVLLLIGSTLLVDQAFRPAPTTSGIVEKTPEQAFETESERARKRIEERRLKSRIVEESKPAAAESSPR